MAKKTIAGNYPKTFIADFLPKIEPRLIAFYNEQSEKNSYFKEPITQVIEDVIISNFMGMTERETLKKIGSERRNYYLKKKRRWVASLDNQLSTYSIDEPQFPFRELSMAHVVLSDENWNKVYGESTVEELIDEKRAEVEVWIKDLDSRLLDYPALSSLSKSSIFSAFQMDLFINIYQIMDKEYDFRLDTLLTKTYIDEMGENPFFTDGRTKHVLEEGKSELVEEVDMGDDTKLIVSVSQEAFGDSKAITFLDSKDQDLLNFIIKEAMKYDTVTTSKPLAIELNSLARICYRKKPSSRVYEEAKNRIYKIVNFTYNRFENGVQVGAYNLLDKAEPFEIEGKKYMNVWVGSSIKESILNNRIKQLPAIYYNKIEGSTAKLMYFFLQKERIRAYELVKNGELDENRVNLNYISFLRTVNFAERNKAKICKKITDALTEYKKKGIVIEDFTYNRFNYTFNIFFLPLSDNEKDDLKYYYNPQQLS